MYAAFQFFPGIKRIVFLSREVRSEEDRRIFLQEFREHYPVLGPRIFGGHREPYEPKLLDREVEIQNVDVTGSPVFSVW